MTINMVGMILWQVIGSTILALMIGSVVGSIIGSLVEWLARRPETAVIPAIMGSSLGVLLLAILPVVSQPVVLSGNAYAAIFLNFVLVILLPLGAIGGGIVGSIFGLIFTNRLSLRAGWFSFLMIYLLLVAGFYLKILTR